MYGVTQEQFYRTKQLTDNQRVNYQTETQTRATNDNQVYYLWLATKAKTTAGNYTAILKSFRKVIDTPLNAIVFDDLVLYQEVLVKRGLKPNTVAAHMRVLKSLFSFAHNIGYTTVNVGKAVPVKASETINERLIQHDVVHKILSVIAKIKDKLIITLMYRLGLRVSEVGYLKWTDFRDNILAVTGKGNKTRYLIVPPDLLEELKQLYHPNNTYVFETRNGTGFDRKRIHTMVKKYCQLAGVDPNISSHWFRHCHATTSLKNGADIHLVSKNLGHSSIAITGKYLHANPNECSSLFIPT